MGDLTRRELLGLALGAAAAVATGCSGGGGDGGRAAPSATSTGDALSPHATGSGPGTSVPVPTGPTLASDPFTLGVASGDPRPDGMLLWTRLAPEPITAGGGMPAEPVDVRWELATDDAFTHVVAAGVVTARPEHAHAVTVPVADGSLRTDTWHWYRFRTGEHVSRTGRTRTAPAAGAVPDRLRVGFASCQDWQDGYFTAHHHLAAEELELVVWLGDFIYEEGVGTQVVRPNSGPAVQTLDGYRARYAQYLQDPELQASRAAFPWVITRDDHEVANNYAGDGRVDPARRAAGYQAWAEHQPVLPVAGDGGEQRIYRTLDWGALASLAVLDERQYRTPPPCAAASDVGPACPEVDDPAATMLGASQKAWLLDHLAGSRARWNLLANEVTLTHLPFAGTIENLDQWDGYAAERRQLVDALAARPDLNPVLLTGDIHAFFVGDVTHNPEDATTPVVATELVGGAISSQFPKQFAPLVQQTTSALPQIRYADLTHNGYGVLELTADRATCRFRVVSTTADPQADVTTAATFTIDAGRPGAQPA